MSTFSPLTILPNFEISDGEYKFEINSKGLINKSFSIKKAGKSVFFLQQIDDSIFKDIDGLMHNIEVVCNHFEMLPKSPKHLNLIYAKDTKPYFKSNKNEFWRLYEYMEGETFFKAKSENIAKEAGSGFGEFLGALSNLRPDSLSITIPNFHDINSRLDQYTNSLASASEERLRQAQPWIDLIAENRDFVKAIYAQVTSICPLRISHNDTKLSNLLFDVNGKAKCVVDYDTLMPGYIPLDFGDSVRTICSTTVEDDPHFDRTIINMDLFESFTKSFINSIKEVVTQEELQVMSATVAYMPFLMGLRMLTDFLNNDLYYSTNYKNHNLDRAANQFSLFKNAVSLENEMKTIINS